MKIKVKNPKTDGELFDEYEPEPEEIGRRHVDVNGREYLIIFTDPHGLCKIKSKKGRLPDELANDSFTSQGEAIKAITVYNNRVKEKEKNAVTKVI